MERSVVGETGLGIVKMGWYLRAHKTGSILAGCGGWLKAVIPALGRLRQEDSHKFKARLDYTVSSRPT